MNSKRFLLAAVLLLLAMMLMSTTPSTQAMEPAKNLADGKAAIEKGVAYLRSQMKEDTYWVDVRGKSPGYTALAASALIRAGHAYGTDKQVTNAVDWLVTLQKEDGGLYEQDYQNYHTSVIMMTLIDADAEKFKSQIAKAVGFIRGIQFSEAKGNKPEDAGGIGYGSDPSRSDLSNTQYALDALKAAGIPETDPVFQEALKFITRCQNNSETNDQEWAGNDGGFVYRPGDSKVKDEAEPKRVKSYGSMTYAGVKSLIYCGVDKTDPRMQQAVKWIKQHYTLSENPEMGGQGLYYYWHTFGKAMRLLGEDTITDEDGTAHDWRVDLIAEVAGAQAEDGSWINKQEERWMEGNPILASCYALLALEWAVEK